jgi:hypothetical protein
MTLPGIDADGVAETVVCCGNLQLLFPAINYRKLAPPICRCLTGAGNSHDGRDVNLSHMTPVFGDVRAHMDIVTEHLGR